MKDLFCFKKWLIYLLVFAIPFTQIAYAPVTYAGAIDPVEPADAPNDQETVFDLVAIVVDSELNSDNNNYVGLKNDYPAKLSETKIGTRIKRYAEDVVANNELTDTKILLFDKSSDSVESLANALENLYLNGDGTRNNRLKGVVLVGDIPLPVVTREGNRYVSLLPYTDFEEKAYLYDSITQSFVESSISSFPKPEAWHGVMKAPSDDLAGREKLATFFDKNHLYYEGETEYAEFDRKLFFGDLLHEEEQMYEESYKRYVQYLNSLEDLAYQRYNKYWANELVGSMMEDLPFNMDNPANQGENSFAASMQGDPLANLPDMYTKFIIDQQLIPYYKIFNKYIAKLNDWTMYSARYKYGDVLSVPALIAMKDEYTKQYLKNVNSALETQFNKVAEKIQEPLPLVDYSTITGNIGDKNFSWIISDNPLLPRIDPEIFFRFHYKNEETGKFYINGIDTDVIDGATAKICGMYLGSTKTDYFDGDKNFNPKSEEGLAAGGEYSILTRAMSSDDMSTAMPVHTVGVNARMLSPAEITEATDGQYSGNINQDGIHQTGAIVEDNPEYGISAFIDNPLYNKDQDYNNPLADAVLGLKPGDVIVAVNNKKLSYAYTFEQAIEDSYKRVEKIINAFNKGNLYSIVKALGGNPGDLPKDQAPLSPLTIAALNSASINYFLAVEGAPVIIDSPEDIVAVLGAQLNQTFLDSDDLVYEAEDRVAGLIRIDYYRDGAPEILNLTFTIELDEETADIKFTSRKAPESSDIPDTLIILDPRVLPFQPLGLPPILPPSFAGFDIETIGTIFTLYQNKDVGYGGDSDYDNSAGCNAGSTIKNSDRCFAKVATMPVLSPAGSTGLVKMEIPGKDPEIMFPENVKKNTENLNSGVANDYDEHVNQFQFPDGVPFEKVDELTYDMCYSGLPGVILTDSNPYTFPLDPDTKPPLLPDEEPFLLDYYGRLLKAWGDYVSGSTSDQVDYIDFDAEDETDDNAGYMAAVNAFNPKATVWGNIADKKASQVILNTDSPIDPLDGPLITLKDFSDHYGLFDGIDNDGDGLTDFEWRDNDDDGVYETRYYDFDGPEVPGGGSIEGGEANPIFGIPNANLAAVGRKMLSHDSEYIIPHSVDSFPYKKFDDDIVLKVNAHEIGKELSSVILHNEPTDYTVMEQIKAQATLSLPIDNPRYLSFLSEPVLGQAYPPPNPVSPLIPVGAILAALGDTDPPYSPGKVHKIDYVNLFGEDITNVAQAKAKLSQKADQFALSNSSYRIIPGAGYGEYDLDNAADVQLIKNKIYNDYFDPIVSGLNDDPPSGFDLKIASVDKLHDAIVWKSMNIDEKHEYVLKYYLNDAPNRNAYVNDASLYPAPFAATPAFGYEAAYLMLDGEDDFFDMNFNKDLEEDKDIKFNPIEAKLAAAEAPEDEDAGGGGGGKDDDDFEFVMLWEFIKELQRFIDDFTTIPTFQDSCGFDEDFFKDKGEGAPGEAVLPLDELEISVNKDVFPNSASEQLIVTVTGYDQNDKVVGSQSNSEMITLEVIQDEESPVFEFIDQNVRTMVNGVAVFKLKPAGNLGTATLRANSESGFSSNNIQVSVTAKKIELLSYVYFEIDGLKELAEAIAAGEGEGGDEGGEGAEDGGAGLDGDGGAGTGTGDASAGTGADGAGGGDGSGDGEGDGGEASDGDTGAGDDGEAEGTIEGSFPGTELEDILSGLSEGTEDGGVGGAGGAGAGAGGGEGAGGSGGTGDTGAGVSGEGEEPDITVLTSEPVEEVTLESVPVETEGEEGASGADGGEVLEEIEEGDEAEIPPDLYWEHYFMLDKYYEKFISEPEARVLRRLVEQYSDRMLALNPDSINPFYDAETNEESPYIVEHGSAFVADGESLMKITSLIYNTQGKVDNENTHKVRFQIEDVSVGLPLNEILTFWTYENGKFQKGNETFSEGGVAEIYLEAGTKTGKFKLIAQVIDDSGVVDNSFPKIEKEMDLVAGEPSSLSIESDSFVLLANNQSRTTVNVILKDKFGNIADNAFATVALFVDDTAKFDETADQNKTILGTQIISFGGKASVDLISKDKVGVANVIAILLDYDLEQRFLELGDKWEEIDFSQEVGASKTFEILDNVDLEFEILNSSFQATDGITADGSSIARLGAKLTHNNQIVDKYSGPIEFTVLTKNVGNLAGDGVYKMANGEIKPANVSFQAATLSGEAEVLVDIPGFVSDTIKFKVKPGIATRIELVASDTSIHTNGQNEVTLKARLLDQYDNLVEASNGVVVDFAATEATEELITINPAQANTVNGVATSEVLGKSKSGVANIFASSAGLETGTVSLKINKHLTSEVVKDFSPRALYVSLLGGAFGKVDNGNNIAQTLLYSGQVQAVSTITASPHDKKRVVGVDGFGKVDLLSQTLEITVAAATNSFPTQKVILSDKVSGDSVASVFVVPKNNTPLVLQEKAEGQDEILPIPSNDGIYVQRLSMNDPAVQFTQKSGDIYIEKGGDVLAKVDKFGRITLSDDKFSLELARDEKFNVKDFALIISNSGDALALLTFKQSFVNGVTALEANSNFVPLPGIYLQLKSQSKKYAITKAFSGVSTDNPWGFYVLDVENEIEPAQAPGFGHTSLEDGEDEFGLGFEGSNKHMLLFASGNSVGEANIPYASDVGIVFGDPTIRLDIEEDLISDGTGYTKDLGQPVFSGKETITELIDFDFNGDGFDDLLLVYESGLVRLLENEISNQRFRDRGNILNIVNGIFSLTKLDSNNDGFDDLLVGTKEACTVGDECIVLYENTNGHFERKTLNLALNKKKAYEMKAGDMNSDGCEDVVISDSSGSINVFYNEVTGGQCNGLSTNVGYTNNFGYKIQSDVNLSDQIFIYYPGMEHPDEGEKEYLLKNDIDDDGDGIVDDESNLHKFIQFILPSTQPPPAIVPDDPAFDAGKYAADSASLQASVEANENIAAKELPPQTYPTEFNFIYLKEDSRFITTAKQATDINGDAVGVGDEINYLIVLKNTSASDINNLILSDATPASMTLLEDSLECLDPDCGELTWVKTGMSLRSNVISGINVPANGQRTIQYRMKVDVMPEIHFDIGNNFTIYPSNNNDPYLDILIKPAVNPDGVLTYLYSTGLNAGGQVQYAKYDVVANSSGNADLLANTFKAQGLPDPSTLLDFDPNSVDLEHPEDFEMPDDIADSINDIAAKQTYDADYNGCNDWWSTGSMAAGAAYASDLANQAAAAVEGALSALRCSGGGCLPIPYNYAFLAPEDETPGFPILAFWITTAPIPIPFVPFYPSQALPPSSARFYLSPTLSMGLGGGICGGSGPGHASPCFPFSIPTSIVPGLSDMCSFIQSGIDEAVSFAKDSLVDPALGQATIISDGNLDETTETTTLGGSFGDDDDPISAAVNVNVRIPGFPGVITNWMDNQMDEIYNKLLDFPDLYLIYPDFNSIKNLVTIEEQPEEEGQETDFLGLHDFLTKVSSMPLIQIESKEVLLKIPAISPKEIQQIKDRSKKWVDYHKKELQRFININCNDIDDFPPDRRDLCDTIILDVNDLIHSVEKLLDLMDRLANLPRDILNFRYAEAKYAGQIICYMDTLIEFSGGYFKRQMKIVQSWIKAVEDAIKLFKDWKLILDLIVEYQESCDQCKNDRFSKLALLMQLFAAIPEPPVIPLPKWPDLVFDFSQIRTGTKIVWPDVVFKPQPVHLPNVPPYFTLPDLPNIKITIPGFEVPDFPEFVLPNLPDLPPLPLPQLPDIPRPPKIPELADVVVTLLAALKPIFKILCLLKNGFILVPEAKLGTEIETLTQPSVQAILPIIKKLSVQIPPIQYDYVKEIRTNVKLNFTIETEAIYTVVKKGADIFNEKTGALIKKFNKYMDFPLGEIISLAIQNAIDKAYAEAAKAAEDALKLDELKESTGIDVDIESSLPLTYNLNDFQSNVEELDLVLTDYIATLETDYPEEFYLTASQTFLDTDHPLLNRTIAEVERDIKLQDLPDTPAINNMVAVRDELIAYVKDLNNSNTLLEQIDDYDQFNKILVENDGSLKRVAALTDNVNNVTDVAVADTEGLSVKSSLLGEAAEEMIKDVASKGSDRLLASVIDFNPSDVTDGSALPSAPPIGFYIVTSDGVNENVLNYTPELKRQTHVLYSDVDHDLDHDIVLSMGGDVYLKRNHKSEPALPDGQYIQGLTGNTVSSYVNAGGMSVQGVSSPYENNGKADVSWLPMANAVAYEVLIRNSINDSLDDPALRYVAVANPEKFSPNPDDYDLVFELSNPDKPSISLELENGNYYANVFAINENGEKSLASGFTFLAPQTCADTEPPFPAVGATDFNVAIFKELTLDASMSFDTDGEIVEYYIETLPYDSGKTDPLTDNPLKTTAIPHFLWSDLNVTVDSNGDGITMNDRDNPIFKVGPFVNEGDIGKHQAILHVVDQSGNSSGQEISINVFAPQLTLDEIFSRTSIATGESKPSVPIFPFSLMRNRFIYRVVEDELKLVPRIDKIKDALTKENGSYEITDFNLENMILVENADKEIVAEIDPETGNIGALKDGYTTKVVQATVPTKATHIQILDKNGVLLGTVYLVADPNSDVVIHQELGIDADNYKDLYGVNVDDIAAGDEFKWVGLPASDAFHPGGAILVDMVKEERLLIIDTGGNILILDNKITISQKKNDHVDDPLIIEVRYDGIVIAEIYIATNSDPAVVVGPNDVPFATPRTASIRTLYSYAIFGEKFRDLSAELQGIAAELYGKGILSVGTDVGLNPEDLVDRKEFTRALIKLLCIIPREEAYQSGIEYTDVPFEQEFFPYIKEGTLLGLVEGYKGELDPVSGLLPFKPNNTITRAEGVKIILEALEMQAIIDLSGIKESQPWYGVWMDVGQDLSPYFKNVKFLENNFIVTPEEAVEPNKEMTFAELMLMSERVLNFYNCFEIDDDDDGMSDYCEVKYNIDDPKADEDFDELINEDECSYGLDPTDKDTDKGGIFDGPEVFDGTDGLDSIDDSEDDDHDGLTNRAEIMIHKTDYLDPDTDDGGVIDGDEVMFDLTNPLYGADDGQEGKFGEGEKGIYLVPANCNTCPCTSTFLNKADLVPGDIFFPVVSTDYEEYYETDPAEKTYIFSKGNEVTITEVNE